MSDEPFRSIDDPRNLLAAIVSSTDDAVISKTLDGVITSWNAAAERVFGYTAAEAIGQSIRMIIPPDRHHEEDAILARVRAGERIDHFETVRVARNGRMLDFSVTISPLRDREGRIVGASKVGRDITGNRAIQREAESSQRILQLISDNAPSLVGYIDRNYIYRLAGRRHEAWHGRPRDRILGRHAREVVGEAAWERLEPKIAQAVAGQAVTFEMEVPLASGEQRWVDVSYIPHVDANGTVMGVAVLTNDVDERRRTEDAQRLLVAMHDATRGLHDPREVMLRIVHQVGLHFGVIRCAYGEVDDQAQTVELIRGYTDSVPTAAGRYPLLRFGEGLAADLLAGRVASISDVRSDPLTVGATAQATFDAMTIRSLIVAPIMRDGRTVALIVVADRMPRVWNRHHVALLEQVAQRTFFALESARVIDELRENEHVLSLASRAGRMGVWEREVLTDKVWWSVEMEEIFGLPPDGFEALGGSEAAFSELVHPDDRPAVEVAVMNAIQRKSDYRVDFRFLHADGTWRWMEGRGQGFYSESGQLEKLYGIGIDVTGRKRDEQTLRQQAVELAEADRRKDEFLAILAHELRNPLAPIRNSLMYLDMKGPSSPELKSARDIIDRQVRQLVRLVDDLLDVSRISRGRVELQKQRANLTMIVESAVESSRPLIDANEHRLTVRMPSVAIELDADVTRLAQVLQNLLNNAAKYTPRGGRIELSAECVGDVVVIRVKDNGIGIPRNMLSRVFEMFTQVDRRLERASGGLGIGLTLVQRLIQLHGGSITALSDGPGRGSEFVVRLPAAASMPARREAPNPAFARSQHVLRVLVVDDNHDGADSLAMMLEALGHEVRVAYDGHAGVEAVVGWHPDVALLDIGMPGINGYDLARALREENATRHATLVAVTGWGQEADRVRSAQAGFDHHLVKPVDPAHLQELLLLVTEGKPSEFPASKP